MQQEKSAVTGSLGEAQLQLTVDDGAFRAGLNRAQQMAATAGQQIQRAVTPKTGGQNTIFGLQFKRGLLQEALSQAQIGSKEFRKLRDEINKVDKALGKAAGGGSTGVVAFAKGIAALGAGAAVVGLFRNAIQQAIEFESITKRLTNALGPQGAGKALALTRKLSDELGLSYKDLANNFARFTAAASAAGVPMEMQRRLFTEVIKSGQALGLSNYELEGSFLALQQMAAKGVVQMEELRGQLGERMPNAFAAAARGMDLTSRELIKLVESGGLDARTFFEGLSKGLAEFNAEVGQGQTSAQRLQGVRNEWDKLMVSLGNEALPIAIGLMEQFRNALKGMNTGQEANKLGFGVGALGALGVMPEATAKAVEGVQKLRDEFELTDKEARALWYDALKLQGIKNPAFAKPQELDAAVAKARQLADTWSKSRRDGKEAALAQQAEEQRLADIALRRSEATEKRLNPAKDELRLAQLGVQLEGDALRVARAQFEIEVAKREAIKAQAKARAAAPGSAAKAGLEVEAEAAGKRLEAAMIVAGGKMKEAAKDAADKLKEAGDQLKGTLRSNLDILNKSTRQRVIADARKSLESSLATGRFDVRAVRSEVKTNQDLLDMASKLEGINRDFDAYTEAQNNVARVQEQMDTSFKDLGIKLDESAGAIAALAKKDWNVYVNGSSVSSYGEMVSAMNRGMQ